ncbi:HutD family protein [Rhizobium sp. BE258]|uniref:HutD/Ves family protein n=1 Tax=Rhizobium sp. BE258 TaxID=2817722 RepID=UPI00285CE48F|nr:environmental stress-induced protein Ves [Rhizobium sp. BE258]
MPRITHLKASNHRRMPWKNGGGETVEIAIFPENAALGAFDWRVSMATVASDGPFSIFEGIDRTLSILTGNGMSLAIGGRDPVLLTKSSKPLAFPADVPVAATLADGTITDLNVMTRREGLAHSVVRLVIDGDWTGTVNAGTVLLLCRDGSLVCEYRGENAALENDDAVLAAVEHPSPLVLRGRATCYLIHIRQA